MICPHCQTENPEGARFCLNCGQTLVQRCANCRTALPARARFCMHCGQPVSPSTPVDDARLTRLAAATPAPLARKVRAAADLVGERRVVTILFADVVGSTALAEQVDAETWMAIMNGAFDRITPAIYRFEGTIAQLVGDGLWAFFGAPVAHEDDPVRAVRAALELVDAASEYAAQVHVDHGIDFAMRACLHTGPVVVSSVGDDLRYEHEAVGGAVNLAARLKFAAQPMTVLVTEDTRRFVAPLFDARDLGLIEVKDRAEPVRVFEVLGAKGKPGQIRGLAGLQSPMVGRDAEMTALLQLCEAVRAGLGRAALVVGEPGLGKTRLITEWKRALEAQYGSTGSPFPHWAEGHCLSHGQGLAYHLLIDLLRSLIGVPDAAEELEAHSALLALTDDLFGEEAMDVYPYLGHLLMLKLEREALERVYPLDPQALQTQYLEALQTLLKAMTRQRSLLLILEDLHWADPSSTELFIKLLPLVSTVPMLLCMVTRPERDAPGWRLVTAAREVMGGSLTEVTLQALSEKDSRQLVANLLEIEALPEEVRILILQKAEGNPFFVEEVIRMLIDRGAIVRQNGGWVAGAEIETVEIPDNLQGLLMARIDRLPEAAKHTLRVASVIGRQFPVRVLEYILDRGAES
jgi:class 3 adenylate cyclase